MTVTVFIGASDQTISDLSDPTLVNTVKANNVGLYSNIDGLVAAETQASGTVAQIGQAFDFPTTENNGVAGLNFSSGFTSIKLNVTNTTNATIYIPIGTNINIGTDDAPAYYTVLGYVGGLGSESKDTPNSNYYVSGSNGQDYYAVPAGESATSILQAVAQNSIAGLNTNNDGSLSATPLTVGNTYIGLQVNSSSVISGPSTQADINSVFGSSGSTLQNLYTNNNITPGQANVNLPISVINEAYVPVWDSYVDAARASGIANVAPALTVTSDMNFAQDFATSSYWAPLREMALYGGGLSLNLPLDTLVNAKYAMLNNNIDPSTINYFIDSIVKWGNSEGLRTSVNLMTSSNDSEWGGFANLVNDMVQNNLVASNSLPSQIIVSSGDSQDNFSTTDTNSLVSVSQTLSSLALSPSNSETGQQGGYESNVILSGLKPETNVGTSGNLYDAVKASYVSNSSNSGDSVTGNIALYDSSGHDVYVTYNGQQLVGVNTGTSTSDFTTNDLTSFLQGLTLTNNTNDAGQAVVDVSVNGYTYQTIVDYAANANGTPLNKYTVVGGETVALYSDQNLVTVGEDGNISYNGSGNISAYGNYQTLQISGANASSNSTVYASVSGQSVIQSLHGNINLGLNTNDANLTIVNSDAYLTANSGQITTYGSNLHLNGPSNLGSYSSIVSYDGNLDYTDVGGNETITNNSGTFRGSFNDGYTTLFESGADSSTNDNTSVQNYAAVFGAEPGNSQIVFDHLTSLNDVRIFYGDGSAYIQEDGSNSVLTINNVGVGGLSLFTDLNGTNYTQLAGSNALLIAVDQHATIQQLGNNGGSVTLVDDSVAQISANLHTGSDANVADNVTFTSGFSFADVDFSTNTQVVVNGFNGNNGELLLKGFANTSDLSMSVQNGNTIITDSVTNAQVTLVGYTASKFDTTINSGANATWLTGDQHTVAVH